MVYNIVTFMLTLALPMAAPCWSLTRVREQLVKIGAKVVRQDRYVTFQMTERVVRPNHEKKGSIWPSATSPDHGMNIYMPVDE